MNKTFQELQVRCYYKPATEQIRYYIEYGFTELFTPYFDKALDFLIENNIHNARQLLIKARDNKMYIPECESIQTLIEDLHEWMEKNNV